MTLRDTILILAILAMAAGCVRHEPGGGDVIGPEYSVGGGEWSSGGGITAVARLVNRDGQAAVCGAWMTDRQSALSAHYNENVIYAGVVYAGPAALVGNLAFMPRLSWREDLTGQGANCVLIGRRYTDQLAARPLRVRFPRMTFGDRGGVTASIGGLFSGDTVSFREGPRPRPFKGG